MVASFKKYNRFNYRFDDLLSCKMGLAIPYRYWEVLPGDVWKFTNIPLGRMMALNSPAFGEVILRLNAFYVPHRIVWPHFYEGFMIPALNDDGTLSTATFPTITKTWDVGSLGDYLGFPTGVPFTSDALIIRAYQKIIRDYYLNTSIEDEFDIALSTADGVDETTETDLFRVNYPRDYYTGCMPRKQRGPQVTLPLGDAAPVFTGNDQTAPVAIQGLRFSKVNGTPFVSDESRNLAVFESTTSRANLALGDTISGALGDSDLYPVNLYADLSQAVGLHPDELRTAFQVNLKLIMDQRGGTRTVDWLREHYGVRCSDARLQRAEYLGGSKSVFNVSEVLQTSATSSDGTPQGNMAGHGFTVFKTKPKTKTFEEHGYVILMLSIVPKAMYMDGAPRSALKRTAEEFGLPVLSHSMQDAVFKGQVKWTGTSADLEPFGFRPIYDEYRHMYSKVHGQFKTTLDNWHWARKFDDTQLLNKQFIEVDDIDRPFATDSELPNADHFLIDVKTIARAHRKLPKRGLPGLIDHS